MNNKKNNENINSNISKNNNSINNDETKANPSTSMMSLFMNSQKGKEREKISTLKILIS